MEKRIAMAVSPSPLNEEPNRENNQGLEPSPPGVNPVSIMFPPGVMTSSGAAGDHLESSSSSGARVVNKDLVRQLIGTIPKTKEELLSYEINWDVSDKYELHKEMRQWIFITFMKLLKDEVDDLADFISLSIHEHKCASKLLAMLQGMLDDEGEMFFVNLWRKLIFEIEKGKTEMSEVEEAIILKGDEIPKTKEELLSYEINWTLSDKYELHKKIRPWALIKSMEFFEKSVTTIVDDVVTSIKEHVHSSHMVDMVQYTLDDQAEKFVLLMLRKLIIKIKKIEAGIVAFPRICTVSTEPISTPNPKEVGSQVAKEINMRPGDRLSQQDQDRNDVENSIRARYLSVYKDLDKECRQRFMKNLKLCDSERRRKIRRIVEMVPKSNEWLFSFEINWDVYDKSRLPWSMEGWVSREILQFVRAEAAPQVVGCIMSSINDHVTASAMQQQLQPILGDATEMFVKKMWQTIIIGTELMLLR